MKRALEVRVSKWKSLTLIQVCWPLIYFFPDKQKCDSFPRQKIHLVERQREFSKSNLTLCSEDIIKNVVS